MGVEIGVGLVASGFAQLLGKSLFVSVDMHWSVTEPTSFSVTTIHALGQLLD